MNTKFFVTALCISTALATSALAGEHQMPDGTWISVVRDGSSNLLKGNSLVTIVTTCNREKTSCSNRIQTSNEPGVLAGVPAALVHATGISIAASLLRPARSSTEVRNDSYSISQGGSAGVFVDQSRTYPSDVLFPVAPPPTLPALTIP
ncbi:MAG: hypothetical protein JWL88_303 [Parcubacteria group bacterium]|nr:hypothetical protein [Parcubacteria group bacterium]